MEIDLWQPLAGLGLFLFAMRIIEEALEALSGQAFRRFIRNSTDQPLKGIASGTLATGVLQSSSLVGLMTLALVGAGVIRLRNALGIIFGANLGTTATGWIVATVGFKLDLDAASLPLIGIGGTLTIAASNPKFRAYARFALGVGLLLMGLALMKTAIGNASELIDPETLAGFSAFEFLLFGVLFSAAVQSSSATMMITLSALHGGIIDLPSAAAAAIGADLGTTVTLLIGAFKGNAAKKRVAAGHFLFNLITDLIAFFLRAPLLAFVSLFALSDLLSLVAFHSLFNLLGILLFLPFLGRFATFLESLFRSEPNTINRHLSPEVLSIPETALEAVELDTAHLLKRVSQQNLRAFTPALPAPSSALPIDRLPVEDVLMQADTEFLDAYERSKRLEGEILEFTTDLQGTELDPEQSRSIDRCQQAVREAIHASKNLKDILADLQSFMTGQADALHRYHAMFRDAQAEFYQALLSIKRTRDHEISAEDFAQLVNLANAQHDRLHQAIYADVKDNLIDQRGISALLNVNRELFISNHSMIQALSGFLLPAAEFESLELLAGHDA